MDMLGPTLILYLVVGAGVAAAVYLSPALLGNRRLNMMLAIPFWPLYLPLLLAGPGTPDSPDHAPLPADAMTAAILQVDRELAALLTTDGTWAAEVRERFTVLRAAWIAQAERIRAMDRLLSLPEYAVPDEAEPDPASLEITDRLRESRLARQENVEQLRAVRHRTYDDLMARLAWVRELVSKIHLARFSGASPARVRELLAQVAASGDGPSTHDKRETGIQANRLARQE